MCALGRGCRLKSKSNDWIEKIENHQAKYSTITSKIRRLFMGNLMKRLKIKFKLAYKISTINLKWCNRHILQHNVNISSTCLYKMIVASTLFANNYT